MNLSLLLVEDSSDQREVVVNYLHRHLPDVTITAVASSAEALQRWPDADLIITANYLHPFHGLELIRRIRTQDRLVPILMRTGDVSIFHAAHVAGVTRFLDKGPLHVLLSNVQDMLALASGN